MKLFCLRSALIPFLALAGAATALAAELGQPAPALPIETWVKGKAVDLAAGKGKTVYVVEFWATWCAPCRASIPHLSDLQKRYADKDVVIVGVSDEASDKVKPFVEKMGDKMAYTVGLNPGRQAHKSYLEAFGVNGIPHAFVIDKAGVIAWHGHPMVGLDAALEEIVAGKFDLEAARRGERAEKMSEQYLDKARAQEDLSKLQPLGETILTEGAANAAVLNELAWAILTDKNVKTRDLDLATRAAKAAYDRTGGKDPGITDTYARALFCTGKKAEAIKLQKEAIAGCKEEGMRRQLESALKEYESK